MPKKHTFDDDGSGDCDACPLPPNHPVHDVHRPAVDAPAPVITFNQSPTSQAAGEAARLRSGTIRAKAFDLIANRPGGATCDEVEELLGRSHQSVSSAIHTLVSHGHIVPLVRDEVEVHRDTRSGRPAVVYTAAAVRAGVA